MPLNELELRSQIPGLVENARRYHAEVQERRAVAKSVLGKWERENAALQERVRQAAQTQPALRCALPGEEPLRARHALQPPPEAGILLAADGSQILPDRHAALYFSLINISIVERDLSSSGPCAIRSYSRLLYGEELEASASVEDVSLLRDIQERRILADRAAEIRAGTKPAEAQLFTLTDGTLELWGSRAGDEQSASSFGKKLEEYQNILRLLKDLGAISAAYVDKPHANLIVRMLEVAEFDEREVGRAGAFSGPLAGVTDADLFGEFLQRGERSAVFTIQSQSAAGYEEELAPHFFYLNVSSSAEPWLARVEIPRWVAENEESVDTLQALLIRQCDDHNPLRYPYLLARAHETALVKFSEKDSVTQMLLAEFEQNGIPAGKPSQKQRSKDLLK